MRIAGIAHLYVLYQHVFAHQRMQVPCRRVLENHAFQPYVLTFYQAHHDRTQERADALPFFFRLEVLRHVHVADGVSLQRSGVREPIIGALVDPSARGCRLPLALGHLLPLQGTPEMPVAVDSPLSGNRYIGQVASRNGRLAPAGIQPFEHRFHQGIQVDIGREEDDRSLFDMQVDVAFQHDRACKPYAGRHRKPASALLRERVDGAGKRFGTKLCTVAHRPEIAQIDFVIGK